MIIMKRVKIYKNQLSATRLILKSSRLLIHTCVGAYHIFGKLFTSVSQSDSYIPVVSRTADVVHGKLKEILRAALPTFLYLSVEQQYS